MENCIFCKIVAGDIEPVKIWEDEEFLAMLDINPNTKGMTLLLPKKHYDSYVFEMPDDSYQRFFLTAKRIVKILEKGLDAKRVAMVMEGMGVNHAHLKLYPLFGLGDEFVAQEPKDRIYFENYEGYLTTQLGPQADFAELNKLAEEIRNKNLL